MAEAHQGYHRGEASGLLPGHAEPAGSGRRDRVRRLQSCLHPTQKPVWLCEQLILTYTNAGDTVLDCCMGSGSIGVACLQTGRKYIGMENDLAIFEIAKRRLEGLK